jgi:hypothetical protein
MLQSRFCTCSLLGTYQQSTHRTLRWGLNIHFHNLCNLLDKDKNRLSKHTRNTVHGSRINGARIVIRTSTKSIAKRSQVTLFVVFLHSISTICTSLVTFFKSMNRRTRIGFKENEVLVHVKHGEQTPSGLQGTVQWNALRVLQRH